MVQQELRVKIEIDMTKVIFSSISGTGYCRVIGNSIQFPNACKIISYKNKKGKNENKPDFLHEILKHYVFIFS
jgi:hypothetical protein